jgi:hypothetical protein
MNATAELRRNTLIVFFLVMFGGGLLLTACGSLGLQETQAPAQLRIARPEWHAGDRWVHVWTAGTQKGVKTSEVLGVREVSGAKYIAVRMEPANVYFTMDLHWAWAASVAESRVLARAVPPFPWFNWPLELGKRWEYVGVAENQEGKSPIRDTYRVMAIEEVQVPAGTFRAVKITREVGALILDQYWYSPDVRWYVKWLGRRGDADFEEVLQTYVAAPKTGTPVPSVDRTTGTGEPRQRP